MRRDETGREGYPAYIRSRLQFTYANRADSFGTGTSFPAAGRKSAGRKFSPGPGIGHSATGLIRLELIFGRWLELERLDLVSIFPN